MKVRIIVIFIVLLLLLSGCGSGNDNSAERSENAQIKADSEQAAESTDWEPSKLETINNLDGVTMTVKEGTISPTGLTVILDNNSAMQCIYGESFWLEKKIEGMWYRVPVVLNDNYGFNSIGYDLTSTEVKEWTVDWEWLYGSLNIGEYRIVKDILDFRKAGDYDRHDLTAEFTIN